MAKNWESGTSPSHRWPAWWRTPRGCRGRVKETALTSDPGLFGGMRARAIIAVITAALFALKVVLAAVPMPISGTGGGTPLIPVCTAQGPKWIPADSDGIPQPLKTVSSLCPFCLAFAGLALLLPAAAQLIRRARLGGVSVLWHQQATLLCVAGRPPPSRGPPLLSHQHA